MLQALEIVGFKSFADKTHFEFPSGITVVVGPNGSGKSNIVDAVKWVLGEQSVKSLRGREMADVIFNGSGSRRAMNSAEITLTLNNSGHLLPVDTPEVHITRRVYRSGEGEYLINRQPCRLRDIREVLAGTGLGTHAYSVIEQGKVDVLLQSSAQDRRVIFEEAAGIGRFKLKKIEALRRLERVGQNLLRLHDIVDEVDSRLRSVKLQAGKARRYKEYADRLQELRTQVGLVDWRRLSERLADLDAELASLQQQRDGAVAEAEALEARLLEAETRVDELNEAIRQSEQGLAANRERIAGNESTIEHQRARHAEWDQEIARCRRQLAEMTVRAGEVERQLRDTAESLQAAEEHHRQIAQSLVERERELTDLIGRLDLVRGEYQQRRATHVELMRQVAAMGSRIGALESQVAAAQAARQKNEQRSVELHQQIESLRAELQGLHQERETLSLAAKDRSEQLAAAQARLADRQQRQASRQAELAQLHQRRSGMVERVAVLEELEKRCEGLSPGVKEVLTSAREGRDSPFRAVRGLVADLIQVGVEAAALVEVALGERAQYVVVGPGSELLEHLQQHSCSLAGRVSFLWLDGAADVPLAMTDLEGRPGVLGRADRFVEAKPEDAPLVRRLLGQTWIVEKLSRAVALREGEGAGLGFVTLAGEFLAADGTLTVGPRQASIGLISRRSELRALKVQSAELETKLQETEAALARLQQQIVQEQQRVNKLAAEHRGAVDALQEHSHKITAAEERQIQLSRQLSVLEAELRTAAEQYQAASQGLADARARHRNGESGLADAEGALASLSEQIDRLEAERQVHNRGATEIKVELAKSEERLRNLRGRMRQFEESQQERLRAIAESREQLAQCRRGATESQRDILGAEAAIAELYLAKEAMAAQTVSFVNQREAVQQQRAELTAAAQHVRSKARKLDEKAHARELAANEVRHERSALADRLREDYGIELAQWEHDPTEEEQRQREEVQQEIEELRRKINNLGNVNLEALAELEQLEARHQSLSDQYEDLNGAKNSLVKIIERINADSRRLFAETLQTVKEHFGNLFRDLFGGGRADIVLEEGVDILESGIEIVARPPGKEPRSISLLSGGEKTLTCTALLLAIFRSRPSPFCVLDEVDAALDEANIDRFIKVLRDFLTWTQFIIVTHSKKTMTCANTIYGVTMQESGVSKRVSVRFEDVSENGEFRVPAEGAEPEDTSSTPDLKTDETQAA